MQKTALLLIMLCFAIGVQGQSIAGYEYWFDRDFDKKIIGNTSDGNISLTLDVSDLNEGIHCYNFRAKDNNQLWSVPLTHYFYRGSIDQTNNRITCYEYWLDNNYSLKQQVATSANTIELNLDVTSLHEGIHYLTFRTQDINGKWSSPLTHYFYRTGVQNGENKIEAYEYWFNEADSTKTTLPITPAVNPLELKDTWITIPDIKETVTPDSLKFVPDVYGGATVYYSAKNTFNIRFRDSYGNWSATEISQYGDGKGVEVKADSLYSAIPVKRIKPGKEEIHFYRLDAQMGDSLVWKTDQTCTLQVFDPFGVEVYKVKGDECLTANGIRAKRNGTYFVLLHSVTGYSNAITLDYTHIHKYAVLGHTPGRIGNSGTTWISLEGNGFTPSTAFILKQNDVEIKCDTSVNSGLSAHKVLFNVDNINPGFYDLCILFPDTMIIETNAIQIEPAKPDNLAIEILGTTRVLKGSTTRYIIKVRNKGNVALERPCIKVNVIGGDPYMEVSADVVSQMDKEIFRLLGVSLEQMAFMQSEIQEDGKMMNVGTFFFPDLQAYEDNELTISVKSKEDFRLNVSESNYTNEDYTDDMQGIFFSKEDPSYTVHDICNSLYADCYKDLMDDVKNILLDEAKEELCEQLLDLIPASNKKDNIIKELIKGGYSITNYAILLDQAINENPSTIPSLATGYTGDIVMDKAQSTTLDYFKNMLFNHMARKEVVNSIKNGSLNKLMKDEGLSRFGAMRKTMKGTLKKLSRINKGAEWATLAGSYGTTWFINQWKAKKLCNTQSLKDCEEPVNRAEVNTQTVSSFDPNDKIGYRSPSGSTYFKDDVKNMTYVINFENDPEKATAAAHDVYITDQLDLNRFDINSFKAGYVIAGSKIGKTPLNAQEYAWDIDMRPEMNLITRVSLSLDKQQGVAKWHFSSIDPSTDEPTTDVFGGFLPPNDENGNGQGCVMFSIDLKDELPDDVEVQNQAEIVFDYNDPILTPVWTNHKDITPPVSCMEQPVALDEKIAKVAWSAMDQGSGVWRYTVYQRVDNKGDWNALCENSSLIETTFDYLENIEYAFYVIAVDSAMNVENKTAKAEVIFKKDSQESGGEDGDSQAPVSFVHPLSEKTIGTEVLVEWSGDDNASGIEYYTLYVSEDGKLFRPYLENTVETHTVFKGSVGKTYYFFVLACDNAGNREAMKDNYETYTNLSEGTVGNENISTSPSVKMKISPNPVRKGTQCVISFQTPNVQLQDYCLFIYSVEGSLNRKIETLSPETVVEDLRTGIYIVILTDSGKQVSQSAILIVTN